MIELYGKYASKVDSWAKVNKKWVIWKNYYPYNKINI